jgi:peptidoglycan/LPS O-acetylase OafA/YrhL
MHPDEQNLQTCPSHAPQAQSSPRGPRFPALDGLRGFAAIGVAIVHYLAGPSWRLPRLDRAMRILEMSPLSLDLFFILSGFLIGGILLRTRNAPDYYKTFYRRRFFRILPLYYVWIVVFFVFYFLGQGWGLWPPKNISVSVYLASFLFLFQNFSTSIIESTFIVAPTWSLVVEEHFYVLAPFCVRRLSARRLVQALLGIIALAPVFRGVLFRFIGHRDDWADIAARIWPPCRADALAMGMLLAMAWQSPNLRGWIHKHLPLFYWGMVAGSGSAILLWWLANANFSYCRFLSVAFGRTAVEFACLCLIVYLLCRPESVIGIFLSSEAMRELGKISYCLYLIHWGVLWMIFRFVLHTQFGADLRLDFTVAPIALLLSVGIARLSWKYFESPLLRRAHRSSEPLSIPVTPDRKVRKPVEVEVFSEYPSAGMPFLDLQK